MKSGRNSLLSALVAIFLLAGAAALGPPSGFAQEADPNLPEAALPDDFDDLGAVADQPGIREQLGITDAQIEQLRAAGREALKQRIRTRAEWRVKQIELQELLAADTPDRALIEKKVREIGDLQYGMLKSRVDTRLALAGILTPEQRSKLRSLRHQRMRAHRRGRGQRGFRRQRREMGERHRRLRPPQQEHHRPEAPPPPQPPQPHL
ncbi:MAG: Spy/CpxP family protein refolding chaperone [Terriglobia bacterium]